MKQLTGWRPWEWDSYTTLAFLERGELQAALEVGILDELEGELRCDFGAPELIAARALSPGSGVSSISFQGGFESPFALESASVGEGLYVRLVPERSTWRRPLLRLRRPGTCSHSRSGGELRCGPWRLRAFGAEESAHLFVAWDDPYFVGRPGQTLYLAMERGAPAVVSAQRIDELIDAALRERENEGLRGAGRLAGLPEALARAVQWNSVLHPRLGKRVVVSSRRWCRAWGGVVLFGWDSLFNAALAAAEDPELGWQTLEACLAPVDELGFVPNWSHSCGAATEDRSHPPVGSLAALRVFHAEPDRERLRWCFERLLRWHRWWPGARDRGDGLLAWGSDATPRWSLPQIRQLPQGAQICACWESGMDNSPLFDAVPYDPGRGTLVDADVGLNALWCADAERLAALARLLGEERVAAELETGRAALRRRIEEQLFDAHRGVYANRSPAGKFCEHLAPTSLYPLLTGATPPGRVASSLAALLDDPDRLGGSHGLPSIAREDPAWSANDYWRGRSWAPLDFLAYESLRGAARSDGTALERRCAHLARRAVRLFARSWSEEGGIFENYNSADGRGGDVANSDNFYTWGGLLAYIGICDLVDLEPGAALRVGDPAAEHAAVRGLRILGARCDVECGPQGLRVDLDGEPLVRTERPARLLLGPGGWSPLEGDPGRVVFPPELLKARAAPLR